MAGDRGPDDQVPGRRVSAQVRDKPEQPGNSTAEASQSSAPGGATASGQLAGRSAGRAGGGRVSGLFSARCPTAAVMLEVGGADTYTQRALPGYEPSQNSCSFRRHPKLGGNISQPALSAWESVPSGLPCGAGRRRVRPAPGLVRVFLSFLVTEPASTTAVGAASPRQESASQAGPIATAIADAVGGSRSAADSGPTSGVAAPVEAPRRLHVRASDQGFLPIQVEHYVMLLDWTGRELRADKRGAIPEHLAPIVERLGLNRSNWVETVRGFGRLFKQAAGRSSSLVDAAARRSRRWFQGKAAARTAFV